MHNSALIKAYADIDPRVRVICLCIKHWAKMRGVNDAANGSLSSYAWVLLVIHFLQRRPVPVLPNLQDPDLISAAIRVSGRAPHNTPGSEAPDVDGHCVSFCSDPVLARATVSAAVPPAGLRKGLGLVRSGNQGGRNAPRSGTGATAPPVAARAGLLSMPANTESLGTLLNAFFSFYGTDFNMKGHMVTVRSTLTTLSKERADPFDAKASTMAAVGRGSV
jgi:DNA polymerase sigma